MDLDWTHVGRIIAGLAALALAVWLFAGCAPTQLQAAITTLNTAATYGDFAAETLEEQYSADLEAVVASDLSTNEKLHQLELVRARYKPAFAAYRLFRSLWMRAAQFVREAEAAIATGDGFNMATLLSLVNEAARAAEDLKRARDIVDSVPPPASTRTLETPER